MAVSSDVIFATRSHSTADLTRKNDSSAAAATAPSKPSRAVTTQDTDSNVAACYGIDTVHSWATVSAGTGATLSGWRSDAALYTGSGGGDGSRTVCLDTSPANESHHKSAVDDTASATWNGGEPALSTATPATVSGAELANGIDTDEPAPRPPPRTKRKARPALSTKFSAAALPNDKGFLASHEHIASDMTFCVNTANLMYLPCQISSSH